MIPLTVTFGSYEIQEAILPEPLIDVGEVVVSRRYYTVDAAEEER